MDKNRSVHVCQWKCMKLITLISRAEIHVRVASFTEIILCICFIFNLS